MTTPRRLTVTAFGLWTVLLPLVAAADRVDPPEDRPAVAPRPSAERIALLRAPRLFQRGDYDRGIELLQRAILDRRGDRLVSLPDGTTRRTVGARAEAARLLASLPEQGRRLYEAKYGVAARKLLVSGKRPGDVDALRAVVRRYPLTTAGIEAAHLLGSRALREGRPLVAALLLDGLRRDPSAAKTREPLLSLQTAAAYARGGRPEKAIAILDELRRARGKKPLRIGGKQHAWFPRRGAALRWLAGVLQTQAGFAGVAKESWATGNSDLAPSANDRLGVFGGKPLWKAKLFTTSFEESGILKGNHMQELRNKVEATLQTRQKSGRFLVPAARPAMAGDKVINRGLYAWRANAQVSGKTVWWTFLKDESIHEALRIGSIRASAADVTKFLSQKVWTDSTAGQSTTADGLLVVTSSNSPLQTARFQQAWQRHILRPVDRIKGLPESNQLAGFQEDWQRQILQPEDRIKGWPEANLLAGLDVRTGKLLWTIGGEKNHLRLPLAGSFFLGPPLASRGLLFVLTESNKSMRLQAIQPRTGRPVWSLPLYTPRIPITLAPLRRLAGCRPVSADGVLICRTADERVIGVDPSRRQLLWEYRYAGWVTKVRKSPLSVVDVEFQIRRVIERDSRDRWVDNEPRYAAGRVILTPRDSNELHCLDAASGRLLWKQPRGGGWYVAAVAGENVVVVGRSGVRAVRLADGEAGWKQSIPTPAPSGIGLRAGRFYRLPLSSGEIATIDLKDGRILARVPTPKDHVPGNLAVSNDVLVSQNVTTVAAFPSGKALQSQIDKLLKANANDPAALAQRGELRLQRGETGLAMADLRQAIKLRPSPHAKRLLATALTAELSRDFAANRKLVGEAESLAKETGQSFAFVQTVASALEANGEQLEAFRICMNFRKTPGVLETPGVSKAKQPDEHLIPAGESRWVGKTAWVRGRMETLYAKANPKQRRLLDAEIEKRFAAAEQAGTVESLRGFLELFRWHSIATKARLALARKLPRPQ